MIQAVSEKQGGEISPQEIFDIFKKEYIALTDPFEFLKIRVDDVDDEKVGVWLDFRYKGEEIYVSATGNGPLDAAKAAIRTRVDIDISVLDYSEHAMGEGSHARAAAYIQMRNNKTGKVIFGAGDSHNITKATMRAFFSALNRVSK